MKLFTHDISVIESCLTKFLNIDLNNCNFVSYCVVKFYTRAKCKKKNVFL